MKKLEEEVQNTNERWPLKQRAFIGAGLCLGATAVARYVLSSLGVDGSVFDGDYIPVLVSLPLGFTGAYVGLNCDRIQKYLTNRRGQND